MLEKLLESGLKLIAISGLKQKFTSARQINCFVENDGLHITKAQ